MRRTAHSKIQTAAGSSLKDHPDGVTSDGGVHFSAIAVAVNDNNRGGGD